MGRALHIGEKQCDGSSGSIGHRWFVSSSSMLPFVLMEVFLPGTHFPEKGKVIVSGLYHITLFLMSNLPFLLCNQLTGIYSAPKRCYTTHEDPSRLAFGPACEATKR